MRNTISIFMIAVAGATLSVQDTILPPPAAKSDVDFIGATANRKVPGHS